MDSRPARDRGQRFEAPEHGSLVAGLVQPTVRPHPARHRQHEVEQNNPESSSQDVLGRVRPPREADGRRARQPDAAQAEGLAAGQRLLELSSGTIRRSDEVHSSAGLHQKRRPAELGFEHAGLFCSAGLGPQDVHRVRQRALSQNWNDEPPHRHVRRLQRHGLRQHPERRQS